MVRKFLRDIRGNYMLATAITMVPIMGGLALAVDFAEMNRQRQATLNALDAAGIATGYRFAQGATDAEIKAYAKDFFEANLGPVRPEDTVLSVVLPNSPSGGGTLKMSANLVYEPYFYPAFASMVNAGNAENATKINFSAQTEIRLKNTLEVALVLDNSGSMDLKGTGSGQKRLDLLKVAAKQLVDTIAKQATQMKQVDKPVQFALVPFAASVNVGPGNAGESWMDRNGISPIHHENFEWPATIAGNKTIEYVDGVYRKQGESWGDEENQIVTRFTLFEELKRIVDYEEVQTGTKEKCTGSGKKRKCTIEPVYTDVPVHSAFSGWEGCVEARPDPYNVSDAAPSSGTPATLFVPMFAPDETDETDGNSRPANNNWWHDLTTSGSSSTRQRYMPKYFEPAPEGTAAMGLNEGPNASCTTTPITALVDVATSAGLTMIKTAIDEMAALGGTNVPEGMAWGWRAVSGGAPFTEGRGDHEKGNDKVVIVLTDGENTYYTPSSVSAYRYSGDYWNYGGNDLAGSRSIYSSYGYLRPHNSPYRDGRLFLGTSSNISKNDFSNENYGAALNEQMATLCGNVKTANVLVMTVALDLDASNKAQKKQIEALTKCSSDSRFSKDAGGDPKKLFWNTTGGDLEKTFKEIADELSNLRIVG